MNSVELAIDYGTSNTVAMLRWPDGRTRPLLFDDSPLLSSAVWVSEDGRLLTGRDAQRSARLDPSRYEPNPKRRIDDLEVYLGERAYPVHTLIGATLRRVVEEARQAAGAIGRTTLTHPVAWGPARRTVLSTAAAEAGIAAPAFESEPVAAATYLATVLGQRIEDGQCVLVYDLGAGTFDVTVVRRQGSDSGALFEALAYRGLDDVGGLDFDAEVVQLASGAVRPDETDRWQQILAAADPEGRRLRTALWEDACAAKETLSRQPSATLYLAGLSRDVLVTREQLEAAAAPLLQRTVDVTAATLRESRLRQEQLASVFLVGGGSRMPLVATMLHRALGVVPVTLEQPQLVVGEGALVVGSPPAPQSSVTVPQPFQTSSTLPSQPVSAAPQSPAMVTQPFTASSSTRLAPPSAVPAVDSPAGMAAVDPEGSWPSAMPGVVSQEPAVGSPSPAPANASADLQPAVPRPAADPVVGAAQNFAGQASPPAALAPGSQARGGERRPRAKLTVATLLVLFAPAVLSGAVAGITSGFYVPTATELFAQLAASWFVAALDCVLWVRFYPHTATRWRGLAAVLIGGLLLRLTGTLLVILLVGLVVAVVLYVRRPRRSA